jgi:hypothetical protein
VQCSSSYYIGSVNILVFVNFQLSDPLLLSNMSSWLGGILFYVGLCLLFTGLLLF